MSPFSPLRGEISRRSLNEVSRKITWQKFKDDNCFHQEKSKTMIPRGVTIYTQSCIIDAMLFKNQFLQNNIYSIDFISYRDISIYFFGLCMTSWKNNLSRGSKNQQTASNEYQMHTFSTTTPITTGLFFGFVHTWWNLRTAPNDQRP